MFTSKISDLLLPFGTESAGDHESYPINDISNKYIYDALLMIYLSILLLLLFFFGTFEESIRDSQKL